MNKWRWVKKEFEWLGRRIIHIITGNYYVNLDNYAGVGFISAADANKYIYDGLMGDRPFAVGRTGFAEIGLMSCAQSELYFNSKVHYHWAPSYVNGIDHFKKEGELLRFHRILYDALEMMDAIGTYPDMFMSDAVLETIPGIDEKIIFNMGTLAVTDNEPFHWTYALENKKVLVVCPFHKEIKIQYEKRDLLWKDGRIPQCDLSFDPAIWIDSDEKTDFFYALETLSHRVLERDFDIALLACGHIGLPMAARIKKSGRKAVQMGSTIHRLFGLKGKRWEGMETAVEENEYWIRPGEDTKPANAAELDGETYW